MIKIICKNCQKVCKDFKSNERRFCSKECYYEFMRKFPPKGSFKKGHLFHKGGEKGWFKEGYISPKKGKRGFKVHSKKHKIELREKFKGQNNPLWKGGITPLARMIRGLAEYSEWVKQVFERDNYTCQECRERGGRLNAHHKKLFYKILQELLKEYDQFSPIEDKETLVRLAIKYKPFWDISNGRTLCNDCHNLTKKRRLNGVNKSRRAY